MIIVAFALGGWLLARSSAKGSEAHRGLCALKVDVEKRYAAGQDFLVKHPDGIPGIPVSVIRNGLSQQRSTLNALDFLKCP